MKILEIKYASICRENVEKLNKYAKSMIKNFIFSVVDVRVSYNLVDSFNEETHGYPAMRAHTDIDKQNVTYLGKTDSIVELFLDIEKIFVKQPVPPVIVDEIKEMLMSYFALLEAPVDQLDRRVRCLLGYSQLSSKLTENDAASATSNEEEESTYLGELFSNGYAMTKAEKRFQNLVIKSVKLFIDTLKEYADKMGYGSDLFRFSDKPAPSMHIFQSSPFGLL